MERNNDGYSKSFYALAAAGLIGALGGLFYVYSLFNEEEMSDEQEQQVEELKQEVNLANGELTVDVVIQIMNLTNKVADQMMAKTHPGIDERRRAALNDPAEYENICLEYVEAKFMASQEASASVMRNFGNITHEDMERVMLNADPTEIEKKSLVAEASSMQGPVPSKSEIKNIFIQYIIALGRSMQEIQAGINFSDQAVSQAQQAYFQQRFMVTKQRLDDELYVNHALTDGQLRHLVYKYGLEEDPEVKPLLTNLSRYEWYVEYDIND